MRPLHDVIHIRGPQTERIDRHDILFRTGTHPTLQFNQFLIGPWLGDGSPVDQSMWVDNLRIATARIP